MDHAEALIEVEVVYSGQPRQVERVALRLAAGATVRDAVRASGLAQAQAGCAQGLLRVGVWGRLAEAGQRLESGDRVEIYRPLEVDPKEARRRRAVSARRR